MYRLVFILVFLISSVSYASDCVPKWDPVTQTVDFCGARVINIADPTNDTDAATRKFASQQSGGAQVAVDFLDDGTNEATNLNEIATVGDTNNIFTVPAVNKLLIDVSKVWPVAGSLSVGGLNNMNMIDSAILLGSGTLLSTVSTFTSGDCVQFAADGTLTPAGAPCGVGGGGSGDEVQVETIGGSYSNINTTAKFSDGGDIDFSVAVDAQTITADLKAGVVVDADIAASANILSSKLASDVVVESDISNGLTVSAGSVSVSVDNVDIQINGSGQLTVGALNEIADISSTLLTGGVNGSKLATTAATPPGANSVLTFDVNGNIIQTSSLTWNVTSSTCTNDGNGGKLTVNGLNQIVCSSDVSGGGGSGTNFNASGDTNNGGTLINITDAQTLTIAGGTTGIDTVGDSVSKTVTIDFDSTELGNQTFSDGASLTSIVWTYDLSVGIDPVITFGDNYVDVSTEIRATSFLADASATPQIVFNDSDTTSNPDSTVTVNCPTTTAGFEDCDMTFDTLINGTNTTFLKFDSVNIKYILSQLDCSSGRQFVTSDNTGSLLCNTDQIQSGSTFPTSPAGGDIFVITSASSAGSCSTGGTSATICRYDATSSSWIPLGDGAGGGTYSFTANADSGTAQPIDNGDTLLIQGSTNGIDTTVGATDTVTVSLDTTEIASTTFGAGTTDTSIVWTFDIFKSGGGEVDPTITFEDNKVTFNTPFQIAPNGIPSVSFIDSDTIDKDVSALIQVDCTNTASAAEDCDMTIGAQEDGSTASANIFIQYDSEDAGGTDNLIFTASTYTFTGLDCNNDLTESDKGVINISAGDMVCVPDQVRTGTAFPATPAAGEVIIITDDSAQGACDSAAGTAVSLCYYNGTSWVSVGDGGGGGGGTSPWQTTAGVVNLVTAGDAVTVGSATALAKLAVDSDTTTEVSFLIQAVASQTADLMVIEASDGTDLITVDSNGVLNFAGASSGMNLQTSIVIGVDSMVVPGTGAPTLNTVGTNFLKDVYQFSATADNTLYFEVPLSSDYDSTSTFTVDIIWSSGYTTTTQAPCWCVEIQGVAAGESLDPTPGTLTCADGSSYASVADSPVTTNITISPTLAAGDILVGRIIRDDDSGNAACTSSDTNDVNTVDLHYVGLNYGILAK